MKDDKKLHNTFKQIRQLAIAVFCVFLAVATMLIYLMVDPTLAAFKFNSE